MMAFSLSSRASRGNDSSTGSFSNKKDNTLHSTTSTGTSQEPSYTITRYYYTQHGRTEQSMDVYEPFHNNKNNQEHEGPTTTIVFVMGSGWLGHAWWVYSVTNWWNASGPATIAKLGYRCISVRHSGGFFQVPTLHWMTLLLPPLVAIVSAVLVVVGGGGGSSQEQLQQVLVLAVPLIGIMVLWMFLQWQARGAAHLDDMVHDVSTALQYIRHHLNHDSIILGGYSSGGHVVATWLSRQTTEERPLEGWIRGVLYVSGVLSLDAPLMNAVTLSVFGQWAHNIPSPYTQKVGALTLAPPPSNLPHLVIGCRRETFGIPILDATFCAKAYVEQQVCTQQREQNVRAKCVLVNSNHWSILNSQALYVALQEHLPWLLNETKMHKTHPSLLQPGLESTASCTSSSDDLDGLGSSGEDTEKKEGVRP